MSAGLLSCVAEHYRLSHENVYRLGLGVYADAQIEIRTDRGCEPFAQASPPPRDG